MITMLLTSMVIIRGRKKDHFADGSSSFAGDFRNMKVHGGKALTELTVREVLDLQYDDKTLSMRQWVDQGKLHAVGRYQFVGNTLPGLVDRAGVPKGALFDEKTQDILALQLMKERGINPWVGPRDKALPNERQIIELARKDKLPSIHGESQVVDDSDDSDDPPTSEPELQQRQSTNGGGMACESEMNKFEAYSRRQSEGHRPDGQCYKHVANFIDAMGYGGIKKNGFNSCVDFKFHRYAYQFHSAIGSGRCGLKDVKEKYGNNPYNAPRGAIVVVNADTPGTRHPVAGDIAVASGDGRFWNGGSMGYGGKNHNYAGQLLAIYVPSTCQES